MSASDPRYAAVNARQYPPLTRAHAYVAAKQLLDKLGVPKLCAVCAVADDGQPVYPAREVLTRIFRQYLGDTRQLGSSKGFGRTCWASRKPTTGSDKGWGRLIHDISHMLQRYRHPGERPHGGSHHAIEREVADCVDRNAMIERFTTSRSPFDREAARAERLSHMQARLARWIVKRKRAETAITKLTRAIKAAERREVKRIAASPNTMLDSPGETGYMS